MGVHHDKHYQAYVNSLNKALEGHEEGGEPDNGKGQGWEEASLSRPWFVCPRCWLWIPTPRLRGDRLFAD